MTYSAALDPAARRTPDFPCGRVRAACRPKRRSAHAQASPTDPGEDTMIEIETMARRRWTTWRSLAAAAFGLWFLAAHAAASPVLRVSNAWVRATVPGQAVAAAYGRLQAALPLRVAGVETPVADAGQIHRMSIDDGIMKMRRLDTLDLPAGRVVRLEPGGVHLMLMGLKQPLTVGQRIRLSFTVEDASGRRSVQVVDAPVLQAPPQEEKE
jgi:hypothetical protein